MGANQQPTMPSIQIDIADENSPIPLDVERLRSAIVGVLADAGVTTAEVSLAIVDDATIQRVNARFLQHDRPTDAISFLLESGPGSLEGEIVVSAETAAATAGRFGWSAHDELLLYVIHAALHLVGYDDAGPDALAAMRERERHYLSRFGLTPQSEDDSQNGVAQRKTVKRKQAQRKTAPRKKTEPGIPAAAESPTATGEIENKGIEDKGRAARCGAGRESQGAFTGAAKKGPRAS